MESLAASILESIQQNAEWAWMVVFIIAFTESLAIVGLMVPGWLILVGIGTLIGSDILPFYPIVISAYIGAVLGEYLSYLVGYKYHQKVLQLSIFKKHQALIDKAQGFFYRYGSSGIFFGRFIGPLRAVLPFVAGVFQMPKSKFNLINLTSGIIWAPLYLTPGILAGAAYQLDKQTGIESVFIILLIILMGWFAFKKGRLLFTNDESQSNYDLNEQPKIKPFKTNQFKPTLKINFILSLSIFVISIIILVKSHYFNFIKELFKVLFS